MARGPTGGGEMDSRLAGRCLERFPKETSRSDVSFGELYRAGGATPGGTKTERSPKESLRIALLLSAWSADAAQVERSARCSGLATFILVTALVLLPESCFT